MLIAAAARSLLWGLPAVAHEVRCWKSRAATIPDATLREDALDSLVRKRSNTDGAALFWILPRHRSPSLLRLLVGYEVMADFLDSANERAAFAGITNGQQLQRALADAIDLDAPSVDYYCHHPWRGDGGYLSVLVHTCRTSCNELPAYGAVRAFALRAGSLAGVQAFNHEPDPYRRESGLKGWAAQKFPDGNESSWFELTAAASAWLTVLALLAVAAKPGCDRQEGREISAAYFWISLTAAMLDSYADMDDDLEGDAHSYIAHYPTEEIAIQRLHELVRRSTLGAHALRDGYRHAVIVACMVAMYLSKDSALAPRQRAVTRSLTHAGGPLTGLLLPLLRIWRIAYALRSA